MRDLLFRCFLAGIVAATGLTGVQPADGQNLESFDVTPFPPAGWITTNTGNSRWSRVTNGTNPTCSPHSGAGMARFHIWNTPPMGYQEALITPVIDYSGAGGSTPTFSLWIYRDGSSTAGDSLTVLVNTTASMNGATRIGAVARSRYFVLPTNEPSDGWYQYTFNVPPAFNTDTNYIILNGTNRGGGNIFIDDLQWDDFPFPCAGTPTAGGVVAADTLICGGSGSTNLSLTGGPQGGGITYQWQSAPTDTGAWTNFGSNVSVVNTGNLTMSTWFRCYLTCANGGVADTSTALEVVVNPNPNPIVTVTPGPTITYCNGGTPITVVASGALTYTWTPNVSVSVNGDTAVVGPSTPVTYTVVGMDSLGCSGTTTLQVQVGNSPNVNAFANNDTICSGESVNLFAFVFGPGFGVQYLWMPDSLTGQNQSVMPQVTTTYVVQATPMNGCPGYDSLEIFVYPTPVAGFSYSANGLLLSFTDTSSAGVTSWLWDFGDGVTDTTQNPMHIFPGNGSYTVSLTVSTGHCSDTYTLTIMVTGIETLLNGQPVTVYPNPVAGSLTVAFTQQGAALRLTLTDALGRAVREPVVSAGAGRHEVKLDMADLPTGWYVLQMDGAQARLRLPVVKK